MTSEQNIYTLHFELSSGDRVLITTADFNNLERKDLRNYLRVNPISRFTISFKK